MPAIVSTPLKIAARPDTFVPNTTSVSPHSWLSTTAHAACSTIYGVTRFVRTNMSKRLINCSGGCPSSSEYVPKPHWFWLFLSPILIDDGLLKPSKYLRQNAASEEFL